METIVVNERQLYIRAKITERDNEIQIDLYRVPKRVWDRIICHVADTEKGIKEYVKAVDGDAQVYRFHLAGALEE